MCIRHRRVNSDIFGVQGGRSCGCLQGARASVRSEPLTTTVGVREVSWFAGRGTETEELDCSTKESAWSESESYREPVKDFREVTLSTFSTQKDHSSCKAETRLEEVHTESGKPLWVAVYKSWELIWGSPHVAVAAMGLERVWRLLRRIWQKSACLFFWFVFYYHTEPVCTTKHVLSTQYCDLKKQSWSYWS